MLNNLSNYNKITLCLLKMGYSKQQIKELQKKGYTTWYNGNVCNTLTITNIYNDCFETVYNLYTVGTSCGNSYQNTNYYSMLLK